MPDQTRLQAASSKSWKFILIVSLAGVILDNCLIRMAWILKIDLYLDTVFTVAAAFYGGLLPGLICAVFTTVVNSIIYYFTTGEVYYWAWYLYIICAVSAVVLVWLFLKSFFRDGKSSRSPGASSLWLVLIMLVTLSLAMCIVVSVTGGLVASCITLIGNVNSVDTPPETWFRLALIREGFGLVASEIFARFPVNIAERPIVVFAGYGIALLAGKICPPKTVA